MKKIILAAGMLCILLSFTACKKDSAQAEPIEETAEETKEEAFPLEESLEIELEEGAEGALAPD